MIVIRPAVISTAVDDSMEKVRPEVERLVWAMEELEQRPRSRTSLCYVALGHPCPAHGAVAERSHTTELQQYQEVTRFLRFGRNDKYMSE